MSKPAAAADQVVKGPSSMLGPEPTLEEHPSYEKLRLFVQGVLEHLHLLQRGSKHACNP